MKKPNIQNILVPVDFSEMSGRAIETAKNLARRFGSTIHLVHVYEYYYPAGFMAPGTLVPVSLTSYWEETARRLDRDLKALAKRHGLKPGNCHLENGTATFDEICSLARTIPADLIVMPTHAYTGITHFFEGSTAERVVQHSPCPVLVARKRAKKPRRASFDGNSSDGINTILVPVDFSQSSFRALEYAIEFAERVTARLIVFHAMHIGYAFTADGFGVYDLSTLIEAARKDAERQMEKFVRLAKFRGVEFETVVKVGAPVTKIGEIAENRDVDLVITATHGRTGFKHFLIGSVAEQTVRYVPRSVLVVPSHPEERIARLTSTSSRKQRAFPGRTNKRVPGPVESEKLTKRSRKLMAHAFPERRKTNKFRTSHASRPPV